MNKLCGEILNCAEIKIALLVIMHTTAPVNLHSSPKVCPAGLHLCTQRKQGLPSVTFPIELNVTLGHAHFQGKLYVHLLVIPIQSCVPNLKSPAPVVLELLTPQ